MGKGHEVSAFVLRLVQECLDPATVIFETPQGLEVREGTADHPWNCGHCFQNDGAMAVAALKERVGQESQEPHAAKGEPVGRIRGCMVIDLQLAIGLIVPRHRFCFRARATSELSIKEKKAPR